MKPLTEKVIRTLIKEEFESSKYWLEKTQLLVDAAEDLGFKDLAEELTRESF